MLHLRPALAATLLVVLAACGGTAPSSGATASPEASSAATVVLSASDEASESADPGTSEEPTPTEDPTQTDDPAESVGPSPSVAPSPSDDAGSAAACSGNADNRRFFARSANQVDWAVLCAVLPKGWFVSEGSYRLANGGKLVISYKGPGGATLTLSEGAWCTSADGCVPAGSDLGDANLGPLGGTLYQTADGFAISSAAGENPSWLMMTKGLDQATTTRFGAALVQVGS
jgi:hypothetical protein